MDRISVIIPVYNEAENIGNIIARIRNVLKESYEIIVVDDGSTDDTFAVAKQAEVNVVRHPYNIGNGAAIKTGVRASSGNILVFMDGDGQHQPEDIPKLIGEMEIYDMVVGSRTRDSKVSKFRTFGNYCITKVANYLSGMKIPDLTSGFRAIKRNRMLEFLHILPNTYSYPTTITLALLKSGYLINYIPLNAIKKRSEGTSSIRPFRDGVRFIMLIFRIIMLFDPLKIFMPSSIFLVILGLITTIINIIMIGGIQESSMILLFVGVLVFFFGLLADQLSHIRRELKGENL